MWLRLVFPRRRRRRTSSFLDDSEQKAELSFQKEPENLEETNPPDIDTQKTRLKEEMHKKEREVFAKRGINEVQARSDSWRESSKQKVVESIGIDKKGNVSSPKAKKPGKKQEAARPDECSVRISS